MKIGDRVTDGTQTGHITGIPMKGWFRVYWNSSGDLHHETVREEDILVIKEVENAPKKVSLRNSRS